MDERTAREAAAQLRRPHGEHGYEVGEKMNTGNREMNLRTVSKVRELNPKQVLEIGFGNGFFIGRLFDGTALQRYTGVDFSAEMISAAAKKNAERIANGSVVLHKSTADRMPVPDASQDLVLAVNVVYFWENPARELREIFRVLKPGGKLLLAIRPKAQMQYLPFTAYGFSMYAPEELRTVVEACGFCCIELDTAESDSFDVNGSCFYLESTLALFSKNV